MAAAAMKGQADAARALIETFAAGGVQHAVISPGSRNTPLVLAAEASALRCHVVLDERSAGFLALGLAKRSGRPPLLICTSGSALSHYLPALVEADASRLPIIVLSASRPGELLHCGAPQAMDQAQTLASACRATQSLPIADARGAAAWPSAAISALARAWGSPEGPVHLDCPLREPLWAPGCESSKPVVPRFSPNLPLPDLAALAALAPQLSARRGLLVLGPMHGAVSGDDRLTAALRRFLEASGWPVWAEPASRQRGKLAPFELSGLGATRIAELPAPELVLQLGTAPTSKPLRSWLEARQGDHWLLDRDGRIGDCGHRFNRLIAGDEASSLDALAPTQAAPDGWLESWRLEPATGNEEDPMGEAAVMRRALVGVERAWIASSMPIRHLDNPAAAEDCPPMLLCSRGLNGIDGTIASALGASLAHDEALTVVLGDGALLHDLGGLALAAQRGADLAILVIDNGGGGIFRRLPIAQHPTAFTRFFETPSGLDLGAIAEGLGLPTWRVDDGAELAEAIAAWRGTSGPRLLLVRVAP